MRWKSPEVARTTLAGEVTPHQQWTCRVCCLCDVICNKGVPFRQHWGCSECTARFLFLVTVTLTYDLWRWHSKSYEWRTKHVFHVNLAEIHSAVPGIHCRMRVPRKKTCRRFQPISRLKLVAMATSLDQSGNQYQIEHLQECVYHAREFGEDRSCSFRDLFALSDR